MFEATVCGWVVACPLYTHLNWKLPTNECQLITLAKHTFRKQEEQLAWLIPKLLKADNKHPHNFS